MGDMKLIYKFIKFCGYHIDESSDLEEIILKAIKALPKNEFVKMIKVLN
jgi:hypothetical protein